MEAILRNLRSQIESQSLSLDAIALDSLLTDLERYPITLSELQTTRVGKLLNELRRKPGVSSQNNARMRSIIKIWRSMVDDAAAASSISTVVNKSESPLSRPTPPATDVTKLSQENGRKSVYPPSPVDSQFPVQNSDSIQKRPRAAPAPTDVPSAPISKNGSLVQDLNAGVLSSYAVSSDVLSLKSDKSNRSGSQRTVTSTTTAKVKSTADLMAEYKNTLGPGLADHILSQDTVKEPALPKSVLPQSARPRHLKEKQIPQSKRLLGTREHVPTGRNSIPHSAKLNGTSAHKRSSEKSLMDVKTLIVTPPLNKSKRGRNSDFHLSTQDESFDPGIEISTSKDQMMQKFLESIKESENLPQQFTHNVSPSLQSDKDVKEDGLLTYPTSTTHALSNHIHKAKRKKSKAHHTVFPVTNHMDYWPELPPLVTEDASTPRVSLSDYSSDPYSISSEVFLSSLTLPNRNCTQIVSYDGTPLKNVEFTECFTAPLNDDTNIHVLPWCCLQNGFKNNPFIASADDRLHHLMQRSAAW